MYKGKKILGVITARGGSKNIPRKNIKLLGGKPLIAYTIEAAKKSKFLTKCIVSTEDKEISEVAKQFGAQVPFLRPSELAQDDSKSIDVVKDVLQKFARDYKESYDYVMILQPTSPLRTSDDIDESIKIIVDNKADSVMSLVELTDFSLKKLKKIESGLILPWAEAEGKLSSRRQNLSRVYKRNCAIYLTRVDLIMQDDLFGNISRPYIMPEERSIDINNLAALALAEFWLKYRKNNVKK